VSVLTGEKRRLTMPPAGTEGDYLPAFSPTGHAIAFSRLAGPGAGELFLLNLRDDFGSLAEARSLTADNRKVTGVGWHPSGDRILYASIIPGSMGGQLKVASTSALRMPEEISLAEEGIADLDLGRHLVYSRTTGPDTNIWRAAIRTADAASEPLLPLISSTRADMAPQYSPDANKIAFVSDRSGTREIWISNSDGSNAVQLTSFGGPLVGPPNWSSDGRRLVFHVRLEGQSDLFTISTNGGQPTRLT